MKLQDFFDCHYEEIDCLTDAIHSRMPRLSVKCLSRATLLEHEKNEEEFDANVQQLYDVYAVSLFYHQKQ